MSIILNSTLAAGATFSAIRTGQFLSKAIFGKQSFESKYQKIKEILNQEATLTTKASNTFKVLVGPESLNYRSVNLIMSIFYGMPLVAIGTAYRHIQNQEIEHQNMIHDLKVKLQDCQNEVSQFKNLERLEQFGFISKENCDATCQQKIDAIKRNFATQCLGLQKSGINPPPPPPGKK